MAKISTEWINSTSELVGINKNIRWQIFITFLFLSAFFANRRRRSVCTLLLPTFEQWIKQRTTNMVEWNIGWASEWAKNIKKKPTQWQFVAGAISGVVFISSLSHWAQLIQRGLLLWKTLKYYSKQFSGWCGFYNIRRERFCRIRWYNHEHVCEDTRFTMTLIIIIIRAAGGSLSMWWQCDKSISIN